jgi:hypothetical protein
MLSSSKDLNNIPVSISILYDQEFNNLWFLRKILNKYGKRRAFSETKINKNIVITGTMSPQIPKSKPLYEPPEMCLDN